MLDSSEISVQALNVNDDTVVRLLQLTDCHILADVAQRMKGMNTRQSFEAVCRAAIADNPGLDLLLATGDLSQDASAASYRYLAEQFSALGLPVFWLPGNHDDASLMREYLRGERIFAAKQVRVGDWLIVMLDSTLPDEAGGQLARAQLDFLETALQAHTRQHVLVCLHHQALPAGSEWIDRLGLRQAQALTDMLRSHANVRAVLWGHVHQQAHHHRDGIEWMSTPSTCVQFKPGSKDFALDDLAPGYRRIDLHADGSIATAVHRVEGIDFGRG